MWAHTRVGVAKWFILLVVGLFGLGVASVASAHPGNTDSQGGHTCRTNCEDWGLSYGQYHHHGGGGSGGTSGSPADTDTTSGSPSEPSGTGEATPVDDATTEEAAPDASEPAAAAGSEEDLPNTGLPVVVYGLIGISVLQLGWILLLVEHRLSTVRRVWWEMRR